MIRIPQDFLDFLKLLNRTESRYLLIGGYAVAFYGYVRATGDLDVFVECSAENAVRLTKACDAFGLGKDVCQETFLEPGRVLRFGVPPMRLEILNEISGVSFEECWSSRQSVALEGEVIPVISLDKLLANKRASGRIKDLLDLEQLSEEAP